MKILDEKLFIVESKLKLICLLFLLSLTIKVPKKNNRHGLSDSLNLINLLSNIFLDFNLPLLIKKVGFIDKFASEQTELNKRIK